MPDNEIQNEVNEVCRRLESEQTRFFKFMLQLLTAIEEWDKCSIFSFKYYKLRFKIWKIGREIKHLNKQLGWE